MRWSLTICVCLSRSLTCCNSLSSTSFFCSASISDSRIRTCSSTSFTFSDCACANNFSSSANFSRCSSPPLKLWTCAEDERGSYRKTLVEKTKFSGITFCFRGEKTVEILQHNRLFKQLTSGRGL